MSATASDTLLLTGFEPFGDNAANPSEHIALTLDGEVIDGCVVKGMVLPVVFGEAARILLDAVQVNRPKAVICLGLAENRSTISVERLAVNLADARIPDNAGNQPEEEVIVTDGPAACWSTLPVKSLASALAAKHLPVEISMSAGTYVCNELFYRLLQAQADRPDMPAGFIHLPPPEKLGDDGLTTLTDAVRVILESVCASPAD